MSTIKNYITGFVLSLALTVLALALLWLHEAEHHQFPTHEALYALFTLLAILQLFVQLYFFLHVGQEAAPRWNLMALCFALIVVCILVGGTLWIMSNLAHGQAQNGQPFIGNQITVQDEDD